MKQTLIKLSLSAGMLAVLSSCSTNSSTNDPFSDADELAIGEGALPPWVTDDYTEEAQVAADPRTLPPIPEPGETLPDNGGSFSSSQNQEADTPPLDDNFTETFPTGPVVKPQPALPKPKPTQIRSKTPRITKPTYIKYTVRKGDNLSVIAARSRTTVAAIRRSSGIKGDLIHPGQVIRVPYTPKGYKASKSSKSRKSSKSSTRRGSSYTVKSGDTMSGIAAKHGVSLSKLLKANKMSQSQARSLQIGKKIIIP